MKTEKVGATFSLSGPNQRQPIDKLKLAFRSFMEVYSRHPVIVTGRTRLVVETLGKIVPWLKEQLGDNLLAVTLGGSSVRGLNSLAQSDVDYYIYTRSISADLRQRIELGSEQILRAANLAPCDTRHSLVMEKSAFSSISSVLGVFAGHFIYKGNIPELEKRALAMIESIMPADSRSRQELLGDFKADFNLLTGCTAEYAANKYLRNRAPSVIGEMAAVALRFDTDIEQQLAEIARPFIEARRRIIPFPAAVESLFTKE